MRAVVAMRKGSFWRENRTVPYRPVTDWQVWNEPNYPAYWDGRPNARQYVSLVQRTRSALRSRDRRAKVLLAGMPNSKTPRSVSASRFLRQIYRVRGARAAFDGVGVHPYARDARGVLRALKTARRIMNRGGGSPCADLRHRARLGHRRRAQPQSAQLQSQPQGPGGRA